MIVTKNILIEQIRRILSGGIPSDRDRVKDEELALSIADVANGLLKVETLQGFNIEGGTIPSGAVIASYYGIPLTTGPLYDKQKTAVATLPVTPINLPEGIGVYEVYPSGRPHQAYIYLPSGLLRQWLGTRKVNPIHRQLYTYDSGKVTIFDDLVGAGVSSIDMKLVVMDVWNADGNDPLAIPPEFIDPIIKTVAARYQPPVDTLKKETNQVSPTNRN